MTTEIKINLKKVNVKDYDFYKCKKYDTNL